MMFTACDEKKEHDPGLRMEQNVWGGPTPRPAPRLAPQSQDIRSWDFYTCTLKNVIGIYLQKAQFFLKKKKKTEFPISMNNQKTEKKESETSGFKNIPDNLVINSRSVGF